MRIIAAFTLVAALAGGRLSGQLPGIHTFPKTPSSEPAVAEPAADWTIAASISGYVIPDDKDYLSPLLVADHDWLHLEARHNYEALDTASVWFGYNFSMGEKWTLDVTPMVGGVFGHTQGVAPGFRLTLGRGSLEFTSESEYLFDADSSDDNFLYTWSELTWSFTDNFWVGIVGQRTRTFETGLDIQRGVLVGFAVKGVEFTTYVFNWGWTDPTIVFSVGVEF